jgi:hypothetical protein
MSFVHWILILATNDKTQDKSGVFKTEKEREREREIRK